MKFTILPMLLALSAPAAAETCEQHLQAELVRQREIAINIYIQHAPRFLSITLRMAGPDELPSNVWAQSHPLVNTIAIAPKVCDLPEHWQAAEVAHEFGHIITDAFYPQFMDDQLAHPTRHNFEQDEHFARYYGAKLLTTQYREDLLATFTAKCNNGSAGYCNLRDDWVFGFTH